MTCRQVSTYNGATGSGKPAGGGYTTEADCLSACKEGACCEGTSCSIKPRCQCQGTGQTFKGVGTTCSPNPCLQTCEGCVSMPESMSVSITSSAGDALDAIGATFGKTSYILAYTPGFYFTAPCLGSSQVCGSGAGALLETARWDGGAASRITLGGSNSYCTPSGPSDLGQAVMVCAGRRLTFYWAVGNLGTSIVQGCEASVYAMPTGINPLIFRSQSVACSPFRAVMAATFGGKTFTATVTEYTNPLP